MDPLELVVRNARVATAADLFEADIGITGGRVVALARRLPAAPSEIKDRQNNPPICVVGGVTVWSRKRGRCRVRCRCERRRFAVEMTRFGAAGNDGSVSGRGWAAGRR